jgi:hypothetical protein
VGTSLELVQIKTCIEEVAAEAIGTALLTAEEETAKEEAVAAIATEMMVVIAEVVEIMAAEEVPVALVADFLRVLKLPLAVRVRLLHFILTISSLPKPEDQHQKDRCMSMPSSLVLLTPRSNHVYQP